MSLAGPPAPPDLTEPPAPRPRRPLLVIGLVAVVTVAAGTAGLIGYRHFTADSGSPLPPNVLPAGVTSAPTLTWTTEIGSGGASFGPITNTDHIATQRGYIDGGNVLLTTVVENGNTTLLALDATTGEVRWTADTGAGSCTSMVVDRTVTCSDGNESSTVRRIDIDTGETRATVSVDYQVVALTESDETLYTGGTTLQGGILGSAISREGDELWRTEQAQKDACDGNFNILSGAEASVAADLVTFSIPGSPSLVLDRSDGSLRAAASVGASRVGDGLLALPDCDRTASTIVADTGAEFQVSSFVRPAYVTASSRSVPLVSADGSVYTSDGVQTWNAGGEVDGVAAAVGDVIVTRQADALVGHDMDSGAERWSMTTQASVGTTDGAVLVLQDDTDAVGISAATGAEVWRLPLGKRGSIGAGSTAGMIVQSQDSISVYRPGGPPTEVTDTVGSATDDPGGQDISDSENPGGPDGDDYVTRCGTPPTFTPVAMSTEADGLHVTMNITAQCPDGDVLSSTSTRLAVASNGQNVAAATFDLSATPIAVPSPGTGSTKLTATKAFTFPLGTFWRTDRDLGITTGTTRSLPERDLGTTFLVECEQSGASGDQRLRLPDNTIDLSPLQASAPASPIAGDPESAAFDALRAIADADRPTVTADLADRWVPQLSSKRPGLVAEGRVWDNSATLEEHLALRLRFPDTRLVWTGEWSTFSFSDFWVTVSGSTFGDADSALGWCRSNNLDREHCYAKMISTTRPVDGSTKTQ
ncbi:outer membrane protein assembly factor BamB family protein [Rhodococcoides kroppenstedtii]|uniref:outer membrane protein assembly factor BamB family protein n=1 Tax=Rhodococcoides kroppenstedtii TaxID=293050 RepID=UPI003639E584